MATIRGDMVLPLSRTVTMRATRLPSSSRIRANRSAAESAATSASIHSDEFVGHDRPYPWIVIR